MASAWWHGGAGKTGRNASGRPLSTTAQLRVELLEDRLAPSTGSHTLFPDPTPIHGPGTQTVDKAIVPTHTTHSARSRGLSYSILGPVQSGPVQRIVASLPPGVQNGLPIQLTPRGIDPGGAGLLETNLAQQNWNPLVHTSFWQTTSGEQQGLDVGDDWLSELYRAKHKCVPMPATPAPEPENGTITEPSATETGPLNKDTVDKNTPDTTLGEAGVRIISPPARADLVCRLVMQARPGYLIAIVLLLSWTALEPENHRQGHRVGVRQQLRWLPGKRDLDMSLHPTQALKAARAPPCGLSSRITKGQTTRSALCR